MTLTLLLDLDDTLLSNSMDVFIPQYLRHLSTHMSPYAPPEQFASQLMRATSGMMENQDPNRTLKETFDQNFYAQLNLDYNAVQAPLNDFYTNVFPTLQHLTQPRPQAIALVQGAIERDYTLAIATNPLFPHMATHHRLAWAGLPVTDLPFAAVTTYEDYHFSKPNPAYYAELLAHIGWPEGPVVMVGDDPQADIAAASDLGLATFWLADGTAALPPNVNLHPSASSGSLHHILPWLDATPPESLLPCFDHPTALTAILQATPAAINSLTRQLPPQFWSQRPTPDEWSLTEVLCHLRDTEIEVNLARIERLTQQHNPIITGTDTDAWAQQRGYINQDGKAALANFVAARQKSLRLLNSLDQAGWQRPAKHTIFGPTQLQELVSFTARHDRLHIQQIHKLIAAVN